MTTESQRDTDRAYATAVLYLESRWEEKTLYLYHKYGNRLETGGDRRIGRITLEKLSNSKVRTLNY